MHKRANFAETILTDVILGLRERVLSIYFPENLKKENLLHVG